MTPKELAVELIQRYAAGRPESARELYADDVVVTEELAIPAPRVWRGKARIEAAVAASGGLSRMYDDITISDLEVHETTDPGIVIAEWTYTSRIGGSEVVNRNIIVVECRDGLIVSSRDYHNYAMRAVAAGDVPTFIEQVTAAAVDVPVDCA